MGRPDRRPPAQREDRPFAGHRRDDRRRERLGVVERWQQPADGPREQRLARTRAARRGAVRDRRRGRSRAPVAPRAGRGPRQGPASAPPADPPRRPQQARSGRQPRPRAPPARSGAGRAGSIAATRRRTASAASRSVRTPTISMPSARAASRDDIGRHDDPPDAAPRERRDHGQDARDGRHVPAERQLADQRDPARRGDDLLGAEEDSRSRSRDRRDAPALRRSAGARFTVIRRGGWLKPALRIAPRTRSRASCRAASASPTIVKPGRPGATSTSTRMTRPSRPTRVAESRVASTPPTLAAGRSPADHRPCTALIAARRRAGRGRSGLAPEQRRRRRSRRGALSTTRANSSIERPSSESAFVNMNGAPEFSALIAPRYSLTIWWSIVRFRAPSAFLTLMPVNAFERFRTSWTFFDS